jgi:hypothetical protein
VGTALGRVLGGEGPRDPREVHSVHWYPPGGGGGPKKRHLVLYKLAGFCTADRRRRGAFFSLHSSPLGFDFLSKIGKNPPKMANFGPQNPIFALFGPLFSPFFAKNARGRGDPFFWGGPQNRGGPGGRGWPGRAPPPRGPKAAGGV